MKARGALRLALAAGLVAACASNGHAFVQRRTASGAPCVWRNPGAIRYVVDRVGSRDIPAGGGRDQVRFAFAWWSMDPHSTLRITEAPGPPRDAAIAQDGVNAVAWIEDPDFEGLAPDVVGSTRMYVDAESGEIYEADIWLNGVSYTWSALWADAPSAASGPAHVQAVMTHLIGLFIGLDLTVDPDTTMYAVLPIGPADGIFIRPDEESAVRAIYSAPGAATQGVISGHVSKPLGPVEGAYVTAHRADGGASYGAIADASGAYAIHVAQGGSYRVRVQPYTTDARITLSPHYRRLPPSNLDFLAAYRPAPVDVVAGQVAGSIDFTVTATGSVDDPYEPDGTQLLSRPIATDGTPQLHHAWSAGASPAYDEDWVRFESQPGHLYVVDTARTGHSIASLGTLAPPFARTSLRLQAGAALLAANDSRDALAFDPRSRIAFFESGGPRTLTLRVAMRDADSVGAGFYYDVSVLDVPLPLPRPHIEAALPAAGSYRGGYVLTLSGSGFVPGARVTFGGVPGVAESVDDCDARLSCSTLEVVVPPNAPLPVDLTVTNPDGGTATLASGFTYLAPAPGSYEDGWDAAFPSSTPRLLGYGQAVCFGDYDNDGWVDLFRGANPPPGYPGNLLLHNQRGTFVDVTSSALSAAPLAIASCAWGDYDNDGWLDLAVIHNSVGSELYHNDRDGTFSAAALGSSGGLDAAWLDFDHDGCLDLFVAQAFPDGNNELWRGRCDGSFVDVASGLGLAVERHTTRVVIRDFNLDGWDDLYLANWSGTADILYSNQSGTSFVDATSASGIQETRQCADVKAGDLNRDGAPDLVCSGDTRGADDSIKPPLWINDGSGHFINRAPGSGLWSLQRYCNALTLLDRDNDGTDDLYLGCERAPFAPHTDEDLDVMLVNDGGSNPVLTNVTLPAGITESSHPRSAWATAAADVDSDGDSDLYVTGRSDHVTGIVPDDSDFYWRNATNAPWERSPVHDWIKIRLRGAMKPAGTARLSPAWGEGAKVTVVYDLARPGGGPLTEGACLLRPLPAAARVVEKEMAGGSHGQDQLELLFGLGSPKAEQLRYVDCVIVDWPSGLRRAYTHLAVNSYVELVEDAPALTLLSVAPASGPVTGATPVQLAGFRFAAGARVLIGGVAASSVSFVSENLITCTAPPHPPGVANVTVIGPDGSSDTIVGGYAYVAPVGSIEVVDPNPRMLSGPAVSTSPVVLGSTPAPGVFGFAADGITPVVLRLPVPSPGLVDFAIYDEARRTTGIGALRAPASSSSGPTVTVSTSLVGTQHMGIAILTAPRSFRRDAGDDELSERTITIEAVFRPLTGGAVPVSSTFFVVRPPILLLHGLWSDAATWGWALTRNDPRFVVHAHDYAPASDRSFRDNRWVPALGVRETLARFRAKGLAGTKVATFAHSMGGLLGRIHASGLRTAYARDDNFGGGDFYFLVTVDAAHRGSPLAETVIAMRDASVFGSDFEWVMGRIGMNVGNGACWDLQTTSYETTHLPAIELPVHAFVGVGGSDLIERGIGYAAAVPPLKLAWIALEAFGVDPEVVFPPQMQHDFLVTRPSQEGGIDHSTLFRYVDSENKAIHSDSMTIESNPSDRAIELMNTPIDDASTWSHGIPAGTGATSSVAQAPAARKIVPKASQGTITITAPAAGAIVRQGDTIVVTVQPAGGFAPARMALFVADRDGVLLEAAPWTAAVRVSPEAIGTATIRVVAFDASGTAAIAEIPIRVAASGAELVALSASPDELLLFEGKQEERLSIRGSYADGVFRAIGASAAGTTYDSENPAVATVSVDGVVSGHTIGSTKIVVRNGAARAAVEVRVVSLPMKLTFDTNTMLSWPRHPDAVGYDVVSGSLGQLRSSGGDFMTAVSSCPARNASAAQVSVGTSPALGNGFFYLLRYRRAGGPASYDEFPDWMGNQAGKRDAEIAASAGACAP